MLMSSKMARWIVIRVVAKAAFSKDVGWDSMGRNSISQGRFSEGILMRMCGEKVVRWARRVVFGCLLVGSRRVFRVRMWAKYSAVGFERPAFMRGWVNWAGAWMGMLFIVGFCR